jgi:uncharacterized membrane protein YoaK (UPF0700 family)
MNIKRSHAQLGGVLAFVAGAINAGGFLAVGYYTSHMTGIASSIADYIALNQFDAALIAVCFLLSFIVGAITTSLIVNWARAKQFRSEYAPALLVEALLLLAFNATEIDGLEKGTAAGVFPIALLCFVMGLQNAIITKISKSTIRTTHITGLVTDIGVEVGRYLYQCFSKSREALPQLDTALLYVFLVLAFLVGGVVGAFSFKIFGLITTVPLAIVLLLLAGAMMRQQDNA